MLFAVIYCTGTYGGAITAILFNIPGAPENAPTAFDGYPMTKQGRAGKAVGAAVLCSAIGGTASALLMMAATEPLAKWAIRNIGPPEIFALVFFGLAVASSVGGNTIWKGWMSVLLGLLVATVGQDPVGGINRYNFGMTTSQRVSLLSQQYLVFLQFQKFLFRLKNVLLENTTHQN
jgi:putative tricarboxylic transport membrane protein